MKKGFRNKMRYSVLLLALALFAAGVSGCSDAETAESVPAKTEQIQEDSMEERKEDEMADASAAEESADSESGQAIEESTQEAEPTAQASEKVPTEEEIQKFLETHYEELEHAMTLHVWESADVTPFKILSGIGWESQDESVAVVKNGVIHALNPGKTILTAAAGEYSMYCDVEVVTYDGSMLALNSSKTIPVNESVGEVRLESEQPEIIEVSGQQMTAKAMGSCRITAHVGDTDSVFQVTVTDPQLSETEMTKIMGTQEQLYVYGTPSEIIWKSDNESIATVDENGLVTAASGGINQMTTIRAQVDGTELTCQVTVEAIPQLSTSYRIYGYSADTDEHEVSLYANANEINTALSSGPSYESVISMSSVKFNSNTYPVYYAYANESLNQGSIAEGTCAHTQMYLLGTSRDANVMVEGGGAGSIVTYTPKEGFGIIDVYIECPLYNIEGRTYTDQAGKDSIYLDEIAGVHNSTNYQPVEKITLEKGEVFYFSAGNYKINSLELGELETYKDYGEVAGVTRTFTGTVMKENESSAKVYVEVDGLTYQIMVDYWKLGIYDPDAAIPSSFYIDDEGINADQYVTETAQSGGSVGQVQQAGSNTSFRQNSNSFVPGEWFDKMKGKFVEEVEDRAVEWAVGLLFKAIFL